MNPQAGVPPAGVVEQVRSKAVSQAGGGVDGVLAVPLLRPTVELDLREVALAQPFVLEQFCARGVCEIEGVDGQLEHGDVGGEPSADVIGRDGGHDVVDVVASTEGLEHGGLRLLVQQAPVDAALVGHGCRVQRDSPDVRMSGLGP